MRFFFALSLIDFGPCTFDTLIRKYLKGGIHKSLFSCNFDLQPFQNKLVISTSVIILSIIIICNLCSFSNGSHELGTKFGDPVPTIIDSKLAVQEVVTGLHLPIRMAFIDTNDILVIDKINGTVMRIQNDVLVDGPLLDVNVANQYERGMLGIAISKDSGSTRVFLYFTEAKSKDGDTALGNRLYRYDLLDDKLVNPKLLLDLPAKPGPFHNGGAISIGPDGNLYLSVGDIYGSCEELINISSLCQNTQTRAQNFLNKVDPDGRAGILRVTQDGNVVNEKGIIGNNFPLNLYYAYGIRNTFGMDFDPVTHNLWDAENGPAFGDEINLVKPGFNSGWAKVQGIWKVNGTSQGTVSLKPNHLEDFGGRGKYSAPEFTWRYPVGPTAIAFVNSDKMGKQYKNDLLVGDVNNGNLYHFDLSKDRTSLILKGKLTDKVADEKIENKGIILGHDFGEITDIKVGPDGNVYILIYSQQYGKILKILTKENANE